VVKFNFTVLIDSAGKKKEGTGGSLFEKIWIICRLFPASPDNSGSGQTESKQKRRGWFRDGRI